jgi:hypothetical protein
MPKPNKILLKLIQMDEKLDYMMEEQKKFVTKDEFLEKFDALTNKTSRIEIEVSVIGQRTRRMEDWIIKSVEKNRFVPYKP